MTNRAEGVSWSFNLSCIRTEYFFEFTVIFSRQLIRLTHSALLGLAYGTLHINPKTGPIASSKTSGFWQLGSSIFLEMLAKTINHRVTESIQSPKRIKRSVMAKPSEVDQVKRDGGELESADESDDGMDDGTDNDKCGESSSEKESGREMDGESRIPVFWFCSRKSSAYNNLVTSPHGFNSFKFFILTMAPSPIGDKLMRR